MSDATVQFVELVRQWHANMQPAQLQAGERWHFCPVCGRETPHTVADLDERREVFTCRCGNPSIYTVR